MLLGRGGLGCECGFGIDKPAPPPLTVDPPPRRGRVYAAAGAGVLAVGAGTAFAWVDSPALSIATLCIGAALLAWSVRVWWCRRRWFDSAALFEDPSIRRALLAQIRKVFEAAERNGAGQVRVFLAERGITAPEFHAAVQLRLDESGPPA